MISKIRFAPCPKAVHTGMIPDIGPVAPLFAQFDIVDFRRPRLLENRDQLVPGAVEAAIPPRVLFQTQSLVRSNPPALPAVINPSM